MKKSILHSILITEVLKDINNIGNELLSEKAKKLPPKDQQAIVSCLIKKAFREVRQKTTSLMPACETEANIIIIPPEQAENIKGEFAKIIGQFRHPEEPTQEQLEQEKVDIIKFCRIKD